MINQHELQMGIKDEMEHTQDSRLAEKIALDHLRTDPRYYTKLHNAGLEEEGDMTNQERGMGEGTDECADVAIIKIGVGGVNQPTKSGEAAPAKPLTSTNLGAETPKPLSGTGLGSRSKNIIPGLGKTPPKTDGKNSSMGDLNVKGAPITDEEGNSRPNNIEYGKTPTIPASNNNSDPMDFFGRKIDKALKPETPRRAEIASINVSEGAVDSKKVDSPSSSVGQLNLKELIFQNNAGVMEVFKFFENATDDEKNTFDSLVNGGRQQEAWSFLEKVLNVKLQGDGPWSP